jgi:uncharacterized protein (TIGR02145 family)
MTLFQNRKSLSKICLIFFIQFISTIGFYYSQQSFQLLAVSKFGNGESIPEAKTTLEWEQLSMSNQPVFMKKLVNGTEYYFYNWYAVSDIRKLTNENFLIPDQYHFQIINAYSKFQITPIGIISEQGAFTKVSEQQYYWTSSEYHEKGKRESAVSVSISKTNIGETELKQAYKQEGFLVLVIENEKMKAATKSVAQTFLNNINNLSPISSQPTTVEKQIITSNNPTVIASNYKSVKIGNQIWMTENLNVDRFRNGDLIPEAKTADEWEKAGIDRKPAWCYYNNNSTIGAKYGKLYNWFAVSDPRGLAPIGWHLPSDQEWINLKNHLVVDPGKKMKSTSDWNSNGNGSNESGFAGKPAGYRHKNGMFYLIGDYGYWWSSSEYDVNNSWNLDLHYNHSFTNRNYNNKSQGFSVRCIKD